MADQVSALSPGLYRATVRGVADVTVLIADTHGSGFTSEYICGEWRSHLASDITDARPLIVLDLDAYDTGKFLLFLKEQCNLIAGPWARASADVIRQIEAQCKPARIPEPDKGEFVRAQLSSASIVHFEFVRPRNSPVKLEDPWHWVCTGDGNVYQWDALIDPVLDREGVAS